MMRSLGLTLLLALASFGWCGCKQSPAIAVAPPGTIAAANFDLPSTAALVRDGRVRDAADLQRRLNRGNAPYIDLDRDGRRDPLRVIERREGRRRTLEIRAVPSSVRGASADVGTPIAYLDFVPEDNRVEVVARYADIVVDRPAPITFVITPVPGTIAYWLVVVDRPLYVAPVIFEVEHTHFKHHKHHKWH
jgi:hypothetical protein